MDGAVYIHPTPIRCMDIGKEVCRVLQHEVGGTLVELEGGKCKVETEEAVVWVDVNGAARIEPKKDPAVEIAKKYAKELQKAYKELGLI